MLRFSQAVESFKDERDKMILGYHSDSLGERIFE